jgi:hypothetical protein
MCYISNVVYHIHVYLFTTLTNTNTFIWKSMQMLLFFHDLRTHLVRSGPFECISNNSTVRLAQMCCNTEDGVSWPIMQINGTLKKWVI